ncbi:MarR family winged helix-turn-helix transcriptional regulator [Prauserella rugosa]|uniref:DNA-binding MarR family transcriptional regulator n=1 Tax=Prauserella rugosa TaxID=43354 RepID=A0A660CMG9_9PSEU|nr:MarR family transcriptional regulator [Prauserella rugosa]KMS87919.1 hypothetical protein ACZ91_28630 [Streptomyces regensis]TWH22295.1 DNA-binding MarR family transcriptional regulator [Prauserella rugosa]
MTAASEVSGDGDLATVLRDLAWTVHRLVPDVAGLEPLPNSELAVVKEVLAEPGIAVTELGRRVGMLQSNTSAAVRALVRRGLVTRERCDTDRRVTRLMPTSKCLEARELIRSVWSGTVRDAMAHLEPEQVEAIANARTALRELDKVLRETT